MQMPPYPNLISNSILINETIAFLQSYGGRAPAVEVVDSVMSIAEPAPDLAKLLVADLVKTDPRLCLNGEDVLELVRPASENRRLAETDFVVFDLETTGAKTPPCRVTEIGAYRVSQGRITAEYQTLINPETPIPLFISELTGITDRMVRNAPVFGEVIPDFLDFIGDAVLVAHNAHFDMRFLNHEIGRIHTDYRVGNPYLCTVRLARRLVKNIPNHRLKTLADYYQIPLINHHRASDDAQATARIFVNLLEELRSRGISDLAAVRKFKF